MSTFIQELDDLTKITGIGDSIQQRLRTSLHVQSYADLATLSVDAIATDLKAEKSIPAPLKTRKKIKQWVNEAKDLAKLSGSPPTGVKGVWEPIDSFVLEFQRRKDALGEFELRVAVQHVEHDANSHWNFQEEQERENLFQWMQEEANLNQILMKAEISKGESADLKTVMSQDPIDFSWENDVKLTQIAVKQGDELAMTSAIDTAKRPFLAHIHHEQPIDLEITLALPFMPTTGDSSLRYSAQCQIHNLSQGKKPTMMSMGTEENFGDEANISAKLNDISLDPGIYELGVLVRGERPLGTSYYKFPKLNVL